MAKTIKTNTKSKKAPKVGVWLEPDESWYAAVREMDSWREYPVSEKFILKVRAKLLEWVVKENSEYIEDFVDELNIPYRSYLNWVNKYPELKETHKRVMNKLGRRKDLAVRKDGDNAQQTAATLGHFWDVWREEQLIKSILAEDDNKAKAVSLSGYLKDLEEHVRAKYAEIESRNSTQD